jgi:DNA-binding HxlR family transcriptional regulator
MSTSIAAFLRRKGAIELLCVLDQRRYSGRFTDLNEELNISQSTLSKRLDEAQNLHIVGVAVHEDPSTTGTVYRTTRLGEHIKNEMDQLGLARTYTKLRSVEELFEESSNELVEWAEVLDEELAETAKEFTDTEEKRNIDPGPLDSQILDEVVDEDPFAGVR